MIEGTYNNKTIIITGASAGVGAACARLFAKLGSNIVLVARGAEGLARLVDELKKEGVDILDVSMDVSNLSDCKILIDRTLERFGSIDVVINNAGLHARGDFESVSSCDVVAMVQVNLAAPLYLSSLALPHIKKASGHGAIVMVGSLAGRAPLQGAATYAATKAGLRAFVYSLADELQNTDISVGVVSPGPISTGFILENIDEVEDIVFSQPMSSPEQVAEAVVAIAQGKGVEIALPWFSGKLTNLAYWSSSLRRLTRPLFYKIGRKNKDRYRK